MSTTTPTTNDVIMISGIVASHEPYDEHRSYVRLGTGSERERYQWRTDLMRAWQRVFSSDIVFGSTSDYVFTADASIHAEAPLFASAYTVWKATDVDSHQVSEWIRLVAAVESSEEGEDLDYTELELRANAILKEGLDWSGLPSQTYQELFDITYDIE